MCWTDLPNTADCLAKATHRTAEPCTARARQTSEHKQQPAPDDLSDSCFPFIGHVESVYYLLVDLCIMVNYCREGQRRSLNCPIPAPNLHLQVAKKSVTRLSNRFQFWLPPHRPGCTTKRSSWFP